MPRLGFIIGMVSLTLCCCAYTPMPSDKAKCAKPPEIENAFFLGNWDEEAYPQNHTANYSCRPGYVFNSRSVFNRRMQMTCLEGKWVMLSDGQCKKRICSHPGDTPFGTFELKNGDEFVFGAVVEYSCDDGYQMVSKHRARTCAADGWTNQIPHCEARLCPPVGDDNVRVISNVNDGEFSMGKVITLECKNPKDSLKGPSKIYCTVNGTWNMDPPTCTESCTIQENDMKTNNIQLKNNRVLHYRDNEDVRFECVSGYKISDPANLMIRCNSGILKYPACHKIASTTCGRPPYTKHGEITTTMRDSYHSGSSVKYKCQYLFKLHGHEVIKCQGGMWDDPPVCHAPCTTNHKDMRENHIMLRWNKDRKKNLCVRNDQKRKHANKCYVKHDDTIKFACLSGYVISDPNDLISKCSKGILSYPRCSKRHRFPQTPKSSGEPSKKSGSCYSSKRASNPY